MSPKIQETSRIFQVTKNNYLPHVDGLRAIAVLSVVLFHLNVSAFSGGYVGVDIFFVISGFLITGILKKELEQTGSVNLTKFYRRRIKRLGPALLATLLVTFIFSMLVFSPYHFQRIGGALSSSIFSASNFFFWLEADYFDTSANLKPFLHTWSLSIEEQFYLLWPISLIIFYKLGLRFFILPALVIASMASLALNFILADGQSSFLTKYFAGAAELLEDGKSTLFFLLPFRVFEFGIGAALVWFSGKKIPWKIFNDAVMWFGLGLVAYAILMFDEKMIFPYWHALIPCLGAALIIYSAEDSYSSILLTNRIAVSIGLISYSLYLFHWPIIVFWHYLGDGDLNFRDQMLIGLLAFSLAFISYRLIEQPFRQKNFFTSKPAWSVAFVVLFLTLFASGIHSYSTDGWAWRAGEPMVNIDEVGDASQFHKAYYGGSGYPYYGPIGNSKVPDIVLMGDSHGRHYAEGLNTIFVEGKSYDLFIASGTSCFHLPGFTRTTKGYDWDQLCVNSLNEALRFINKAQIPPVVIISHSWSSQMQRAGLINKKQTKIGETHIINGILRLKEAIGESPLIVIGNVPTAGENLYDIFTRPRPIIFNNFDPAPYLSSTPNSNLERFNNALRLNSESTGEYNFVDPFDYLCNSTSCRNTDDDMRLIYSDKDHLSKYGSIYIIKAIQPIIEKALAKRPKNWGNPAISNEVKK
ncbi:MAG: acyltransferase [Alteromonadaceae bacterium]|nr:acyltransferase [Alteromonadaceae bacterium]